ncbi:MAG: HDOD domain-containing protein [Bryobacteraceae bacterium]|jgi:HD-like signal output (HDOD) protein
MTTAASATCARLKAQVRPFRPVAAQLLRMVGDLSIPFRKIAALVQTDPVLSMELLKIANSPLFPGRVEIVSVLQAIAFIGSDMVSSLVATTCLKSMVGSRSSPFTLACWRHNLATALICQRLSDAVGVPESNGYTAGLVHDVGQLALLTVYSTYEQSLAAAGEREIRLMELERELFELDHAEAGSWLLREWNFPVELQNVAARHENPPEARAEDGALIRLVHAGSAMADLMGMSLLTSPLCQDLAQIAGVLPEASCDLTAQSFRELADSVAIKINGVEQCLGLG